MDKKNIILSLIVSFVFLFYTIFDYLGFVRYFKLHFGSVNPYIENYTKLEKGDKNRVVISFKYDGGKNEKLRPFLKSILNQSVRVDDISVYVRYKDISKIPIDLKKILTICGTSSEKENEEFRLCIFKEPENNTKIIVLNPDIIYGQDFIEKIIEESNKEPSKIIVCNDKNGILIKPEFITNEEDKENIFSNQNWIEKKSEKDKIVLKYKGNYKSITSVLV